ncbi:uncharacterized protein LOC144446957 [Glandiceps talaboti]
MKKPFTFIAFVCLVSLFGVCEAKFGDTISLSYSSSNCGGTEITKGGKLSGFISSFVSDREFECEVTVKSSDNNHRFYIHFKNFDLRANSYCGDQKLEFYDGASRSSQTLTAYPGLCRRPSHGYDYLPDPIRTSGNTFTVYLYHQADAPDADFDIYFAAYNPLGDDDCFVCGEMAEPICIDSSLKCDYTKNCPDASDESMYNGGGCDYTSDTSSSLTIVYVMIPVIILIVACHVGLIVLCRYRWYAGQRRTPIVFGAGAVNQPPHITGSHPQQPNNPAVYPPQGSYPQQPPPAYPTHGYEQQPAPPYPPPPPPPQEEYLRQPSAPTAYPTHQGNFGGYPQQPSPSVNYNARLEKTDI